MEGTAVLRPCSPRLSSCKPSRISRPMFRLVRAIQLLLDLPENGGRYVFSHVLGINGEEPNLPVLKSKVINHPKPATLASTTASPSQLANPAGTFDDVSSLRVHSKG